LGGRNEAEAVEVRDCSFVGTFGTGVVPAFDGTTWNIVGCDFLMDGHLTEAIALNRWCADVKVEGCRFVGRTKEAPYVIGIRADRGRLAVKSSVFEGRFRSERGAMWVGEDASLLESITLKDCFFNPDTGGAVYVAAGFKDKVSGDGNVFKRGSAPAGLV
jgi:hypothetical protein